MKIRPLMLTPTFAKNVKAPGRYGDGRGGLGLSLLVRPASRGGFTKSWDAVRPHRRQAHQPRPRALSRRHARQGPRAGAGERPCHRRRPRPPRRLAPRRADPSRQALETVIAIHAQNWKDRSSSEHQWRATLTTYAFPRIGSKRVDEVTTADVMAILTPIWSSKHVTAKRNPPAHRRRDEVGRRAGPPGRTTPPGTRWARRCRRTVPSRSTSGRCPTPRWARP